MKITKIERYDTEKDFERLPLDSKTATYGELVGKFIRERYSQSQIEAIINNYLDDNGNEKHKIEFFEMQAYRKECKTKAKEILGI